MIEEKNDMQMDFDEDAQYTERKRILFFGLPWTFTKYIIKPSVITVDTGLLKIEENDCYMYKVQDVKLTATLMERIFGLGTVICVICYTGDVTTPELRLTHIKHSKEVKNYILKASEVARMKRRTLNTLDIGAGVDIDDLDS